MPAVVETMAYAFKDDASDPTYGTPWHGLGVPVTNDISVDDMLVKAGLDWELKRAQTYADINGQKVFSGKEVLYRDSDGKIMTHVSPDWHEVQPRESLEFFREFVEEGSMEMNTAGSLMDGRRIWALARVKKEFSLFRGKDVIQQYLLFSNPIEYGKSIDIRFTGIRVVCNNTLSLALSNSVNEEMGMRLSHRQAFDPDLVKQTLSISQSHMDSYQEAAEFLASKPFTMDNLINYYRDVFPNKSKKDEAKLSRRAQTALDILETQPGAELGEGTWWAAYNSVTFEEDHLAGRTADTRLRSAWFGKGRERKANALNKAIEYAEAA